MSSVARAWPIVGPPGWGDRPSVLALAPMPELHTGVRRADRRTRRPVNRDTAAMTIDGRARDLTIALGRAVGA